MNDALATGMMPIVVPVIIQGPLEPIQMLHCERIDSGISMEAKAGFGIEHVRIRSDSITEVKIKRQRGRPWMFQKGGKLERWQQANRQLP